MAAKPPQATTVATTVTVTRLPLQEVQNGPERRSTGTIGFRNGDYGEYRIAQDDLMVNVLKVMADIRAHLAAGTFGEFRREFAANYVPTEKVRRNHRLRGSSIVHAQRTVRDLTTCADRNAHPFGERIGQRSSGLIGVANGAAIRFFRPNGELAGDMMVPGIIQALDVAHRESGDLLLVLVRDELRCYAWASP